MADQNYEIQLNLKVNDSELTNAERRIAALGEGGIYGRRAGASGSRYRWIPDERRSQFATYSRYFRRYYGADRSGFLESVNEAYRRSSVFRRSFLGNTATVAGQLRNLSNFASVIAQIGRVATSAVPALGALSSAISGFLMFKGIQYGVFGAALYMGNKLLGNENIAQGAANLMQMGMAQKGLGGLYQSSLNEATRIAAEYGFSRTGILNTISMLSGLDIGGGRTLSQMEAARIATQAGKIAHVGSAPYERVAINLQQIFGQQTTSTPDLRQLITAAPIIATIAQRTMKRNNVSMGLFDYLKDKKSLLYVLNEFDSWVESNPFMQNRGKVALYKENFYMSLANADPAIWERISEGMRVFYEEMGKKIPALLSDLASAIDPNTIREAVNAISSTLNAISWLFRTTGSIISWIKERHDRGTERFASLYVRPMTGWTKLATTGSPSFNYVTASYDEQADSIIYGRKRSFWGQSMRKQRKAQESVDAALQAAKDRALDTIPASQRGMYYSRLRPVYRNPETDMLPYRYVLSGDGADGLTSGTGLGLNTGNMATQDELSDISKGARGLIINFNREIVNMPVNIDQVNDGTDLADRIRDSLYDVIVRGLNISLNNATGAI